MHLAATTRLRKLLSAGACYHLLCIHHLSA
jgi:hypothetical protein